MRRSVSGAGGKPAGVGLTPTIYRHGTQPHRKIWWRHWAQPPVESIYENPVTSFRSGPPSSAEPIRIAKENALVRRRQLSWACPEKDSASCENAQTYCRKICPDYVDRRSQQPTRAADVAPFTAKAPHVLSRLYSNVDLFLTPRHLPTRFSCKSLNLPPSFQYSNQCAPLDRRRQHVSGRSPLPPANSRLRMLCGRDSKSGRPTYEVGSYAEVVKFIESRADRQTARQPFRP